MNVTKTFLIIAFLFLFSCEGKSPEKPSGESVNPNLKGDHKNSKSITEQGIDSENIEHEDSVQATTMLNQLLLVADSNKSKNTFSSSFSWNYQNHETHADFRLGFMFSKKEKHLITKRVIGQSVVFDIFLSRKSGFKNLLSYSLGQLEYLSDTLRDVNGDNYKDVLFHWYPTSGCCRRNVYDVFLYLPEKKGFSERYEFINPTFSPTEKIIRGVNYGYEAALYKYRWNGLNVDTLEFIHQDTISRDRFYLSKHKYYDEAVRRAKPLNALPKEYQHIESIDWFLYH